MELSAAVILVFFFWPLLGLYSSVVAQRTNGSYTPEGLSPCAV
jgi:hypothetical protein